MVKHVCCGVEMLRRQSAGLCSDRRSLGSECDASHCVALALGDIHLCNFRIIIWNDSMFIVQIRDRDFWALSISCGNILDTELCQAIH